MAKVISLKQISQYAEDAKSTIKLDYNMAKSSDSFDHAIADVIETHAHIYILTAAHYYFLPKMNSRLSTEVKEELKQMEREQSVLLNYEGLTMRHYKIIRTYRDRFFKLDITKEEYMKILHIIFDDKCRSHLAAFKVDKQNDLPDNNILIKLTFNGIHIRAGIDINENKVTIINVTAKKTGNS